MPWTFDDIGDLSGRTVLVTGANSGVGFATALHLAEHGADVVLGCRSAAKADDAVRRIRDAVPDARVSVLLLDLADLASVRRAGELFSEGHDRLDVLVNNAGIALAPEGRTADGFESHLGANFLGHFALTAHLLPQVLAAPAGRVVTVGSIQHHVGRVALDDLDFDRRRYRGWKAYGQSKLALMLFMLELDRRLHDARTGAISVGAHPGVAGTNIHEGYRIAQVRAIRPALDWVIGSVLQQPDLAAQAPVMAATLENLVGGTYLGPSRVLAGPPVPVRLARRARDTAVAARLWTEAERRTGVSFSLLD